MMPMNASSHPQRKSFDHRLPRSRGASRLPDGVNNFRTMCQACNGLLAAAGHCVGAVACLRAVSDDMCSTPVAVFRKWRMSKVWNTDQEREARKNVGRLKHGHTRPRVYTDPDEFVYPANTAAARVWNLATLARGPMPATPPTNTATS